MNYPKLFFISLFLCCLPFMVMAQSASKDKESIELLIHKLFDGMREGDSAKVASVFHADVTMFTSYTSKEGEQKINKGQLNSFLKAVGTPHDEIWDERIWDTKIILEEGIAQVWTNYSFFIGDKFSHCGVDAFHLVRDKDKGWLIVNLMDTRRKQGCETMQ